MIPYEANQSNASELAILAACSGPSVLTDGTSTSEAQAPAHSYQSRSTEGNASDPSIHGTLEKDERRTEIHQKYRKEWRCTQCDTKFATQRQRRLHMSSTHRMVFEKYKCHICGKCLSRKDKLTDHMKIHSKARTRSPTVAVVSETTQNTQAREQVSPPGFFCSMCELRFRNNSDLKRHLASIEHKVVDIRDDHTQEQTLAPVFTCNLCNKRFTKEDNLKRHASSSAHKRRDKRDNIQNIHALEVSYAQACIGCGQDFTDEATFYNHAPCYSERFRPENPVSPTEGAVHDRTSESAGHSRQEATALDDFQAQLLAAADDARADILDPSSTHCKAQKVAQIATVETSSKKQQSDGDPPRLCYGCGRVFWAKQLFWSHSPCFTTIAQKEHDLPAKAPKRAKTPVQALTTADSGSAIVTDSNSATLEAHDSAHEITKEAAVVPEPTVLDNPCFHQQAFDIMPSPEVQSLLVSLARTNPEARPIPPAELDNLIESRPSMLDMVARMKNDSAEIKAWLQEKRCAQALGRPRSRKNSDATSLGLRVDVHQPGTEALLPASGSQTRNHLPKSIPSMTPQSSLTTCSGLVLIDVTNDAFEQVVEEDMT